MNLVGLLSSFACHAGDGVTVDPDESDGLGRSIALGEMERDCLGFVGRELGAEQGSAFAFGKAVLACRPCCNCTFPNFVTSGGGRASARPLCFD